jgi:hypothetical protein
MPYTPSESEIGSAQRNGRKDQEEGRPKAKTAFTYNPTLRREYEKAYDDSRTEEMMNDWNWVGSRHHY